MTLLRTWETVRQWGWRGLLAATVYAALPTIGLFSGGAYAALIFSLTGILVAAGAIHRRRPHIDRPLATIGALALAVFWVSATWSIAPGNSLSGSLQMTGIFAGALLFLGLRPQFESAAPLIFRALLVAAIAGPALVILDMAVGHPILGVISGRNPGTTDVDVKLARGLSQLSILIWPIFAYARISGRPIQAGLAAILSITMIAFIMSSATAAALCFAAGAIVLGLACVAPQLVAVAEATVIAVVALASPWIVRGLDNRALPLVANIKSSVTHQLEIWDYMTARITERPLSGWGWLTANMLPIRPEELARYHWVGANGTPHPHDFWLQLWVETGVLGAILGSSFALLVLWRAWRQPIKIRPFALAAVAATFISSLASFNLATDAWWCAVTATGLLFALMGDAGPVASTKNAPPSTQPNG